MSCTVPQCRRIYIVTNTSVPAIKQKNDILLSLLFIYLFIFIFYLFIYLFYFIFFSRVIRVPAWRKVGTAMVCLGWSLEHFRYFLSLPPDTCHIRRIQSVAAKGINSAKGVKLNVFFFIFLFIFILLFLPPDIYLFFFFIILFPLQSLLDSYI